MKSKSLVVDENKLEAKSYGGIFIRIRWIFPPRVDVTVRTSVYTRRHATVALFRSMPLPPSQLPPHSF